MSNIKNYKLIVVEDDDVDFMSIERELNKLIEPEIIRYKNAEDILAEIKSVSEFDCVILDYLLPGENGLEIIKHIRKYDSITPVVMFTGKGSEKIAVSAMKLGLTDYIIKDNMAESMESVISIIEDGQAVDDQVQEIEDKLDRLNNRVEELKQDFADN